MLGVILSFTFKVTEHVEFILKKSSRTMFGLRTIRAHGMREAALHDIAKATLVPQLTYTAPAWWGFLSETDKNRLQSVI